MNKLGELQREVWKKIRKATACGDSKTLNSLSPIADEMDRREEEWSRRLRTNGALPISGGDRQQLPSSLAGSNGVSQQGYTGRPIRTVELFGEQLAVGSYKELLLEVARRLRARAPDEFDKVAPQVRGHHPYFSEDSSQLRSPDKLGGSLYIETNLNANLIVEICRRLLEALGHDRSALKLDVAPYRTRAVKGSR